jgi:ribose transport system permease protein
MRVPPTIAPDAGWRERLERLRWRISPQLFLAELLEKRWMEPAIPLALLVGLFVYFAATVPNFATNANLVSTERELAEFALVCLAMAIVVISGGIDLSVGSTFGLSTLLALIFTKVYAVPVVLAIPATLLAGAAMGATNGFVVAYLKARPFLTTLVTLIIFRGFVNLLDLAYAPRLATAFIEDPIWNWLGMGAFLDAPSGMALVVGIYVVAHVVLSRTRLGWHIVAVGASRGGARDAGRDGERGLLPSDARSGRVG